MLLSYEIHGFGFPLACDFLKEIGYTGFGKPDTHLKKIFGKLHLSRSSKDYDVFRAILRIAAHAGKTPYEVDKIFWLVGSGNFYHNGLGIGRQWERGNVGTLERLHVCTFARWNVGTWKRVLGTGVGGGARGSKRQGAGFSHTCAPP